MKVLHLSYIDGMGGAGRAAYRIFECLKKINLNVLFFCNIKTTSDNKVISPQGLKKILIVKIRSLVGLIFSKLLFVKSHSITSFGLLNSKYPKIINKLKPSIIHLHWVGAEFLSIKDISKFKSKIVWTMHDMWPFLGAHHLDFNNSWQKSSKKKMSFYDYFVFKRKKNLWKNKNFYIIAPSLWMKSQVEKSLLFHRHQVVVIPHPVNTNIYKPNNKKFCKKLFNLPENELVILFGALDVSDPKKGFSIFEEIAEKILRNYTNVKVIILGKYDNNNKINKKFIYIDWLKDDISLCSLYSAADIFVSPSKIESFGQMALESQACGTPVLAFDLTGLKDIILHKKTGYLAKPLDKVDFYNGLCWLISQIKKNRGKKIATLSRNRVSKLFSYEVIGRKINNFYQRILSE
jgi:glycosyltransferase involved in cell wall biosynthesis